MFRKCIKAHRHILFILQNIECRDLITIYLGPPKGVKVRWGDLSILLEKKKNHRIQNSVERIWVVAIQVLYWKRVQLSDEYVS